MADRTNRGQGGTALAVLATALVVVAVAAGVVGVALGVYTLVRAVGGGLTASAALGSAVIIVAGLTAGLLLWAVAAGLRRQHRHGLQMARILSNLETLNDRMASQGAAARSAGRGDGLQDEMWRDVLDQLAELNSNILLDERRREAKRVQRLSVAEDRMTGQFEGALARHDFLGARAVLDDLIRLGAEGSVVEQWQQRIDAARREAEAREIQEAQRHCQELMAAGQFDQARAVAHDLHARHPTAGEATELVAHVNRQAKLHQQEQRRRMYAEIEKLVAARQWRKALTAGQELLTRHGGTPEADVLQARMDTLRDNARIEEVREKRDAIRDLIGRRRFAEALELADDVVRRFPETAAAEELRGQLDRLRERAAEQAREQQV